MSQAFNRQWKIRIALVAVGILALAIVVFYSRIWQGSFERVLLDRKIALMESQVEFFFDLDKGENVHIVVEAESPGDFVVVFTQVELERAHSPLLAKSFATKGDYKVSIPVDGTYELIINTSYSSLGAKLHIRVTSY